MHIHQVLLIPAYGHSTDTGEFDRGRVHDGIAEVDVIDGYMPALMDELDCESIRFRTLETRSRPGVKEKDRPLAVESLSLVVVCGAGWLDKKVVKGKNVSTVTFGQKSSFQLADEVAEAIGQWGACYVFGHKTANPREDNESKLLNVEDTKAVLVEPFGINGPDVREYMKKLDQLGVCIARAIADHLHSRGQAKTHSPLAIVQT